MKLVLKNSDLVFKTQAAMVKVYDETVTAITVIGRGRLDVKVPIQQSWGTYLKVKVSKLTEYSGTSYVIYKMNSGETPELITERQPFGELSAILDFTGYEQIFIYKDDASMATTAQFKIEVYAFQ